MIGTTRSLLDRISKYALKNRHRLVWKRRLHAIGYGAGLRVLAKIKADRGVNNGGGNSNA